jgi:hypothetical protein
MPRFLSLSALFLSLLAACGPDDPPEPVTRAQSLGIAVLSGRPDMVSGGDALIHITATGLPLSTVQVTLEGRDITELFAVDSAAQSLTGLVSELADGPNVLVAMDVAGSTRAQITLLNHPATGPILSGPHLQPFVCTAAAEGFGEPLDADCSTVTQIRYFYRNTAGSFAQISDVTAPYPDDLAWTEFRPGERLPFVVRLESGTRNRALYHIAVLDDPQRTYGEWDSLRSWNQRLVFSFGGDCGTQYTQGSRTPESALDALVLGKGFAHVVSSFNVMGHQCNDALSAETLMMLKEHFIEQYGLPVWTLGNGASGGAIQQLLIAQNYPGLLDGLLPAMSFPDSFSVLPGVTDCRLLARYFDSATTPWTETQQQSVEGFAPGTCAAWERSYLDVIVADTGCGVDEALVYHPTRNPGGARCTLYDTNVASVGRDPATDFARQALDNVGVQYGLQALLAGIISPATFVDLNVGIGGYDRDGKPVSVRTTAQREGVALAYRTGRINSGAGSLASIPILHHRPYTDLAGDIPDRVRDLQIRERLRNANGSAENQVIWLYSGAETGALVNALALDTMSQWLDALQADATEAPLLTRVARARPAAAVDACWTPEGVRIDDALEFASPGQCNALYPTHTTPRLAAGAPLADDAIVCALKSLQRTDYPVEFSGAEWATLEEVFAEGVCDYSQRGMAQEAVDGPWVRLPL